MSTATATKPQSANGSLADAYAATTKNGTVTTTALNADGTYTDSDASGKAIAQGTWAVKDGKTCFMPTKGSDSGAASNRLRAAMARSPQLLTKAIL
jgi:hypothetical protein